jgi:hypothetical protein
MPEAFANHMLNISLFAICKFDLGQGFLPIKYKKVGRKPA